jgi:hypothetical protein
LGIEEKVISYISTIVVILIGGKMVEMVESENIKITSNETKYCKRCHRRLKSYQAIELGYGPICYSKICRNNALYLFELEDINNVKNIKEKG